MDPEKGIGLMLGVPGLILILLAASGWNWLFTHPGFKQTPLAELSPGGRRVAYALLGVVFIVIGGLFAFRII